jgi:hypothetical protein
VRSGGYHISQGDFRVHFGLGQTAKADHHPLGSGRHGNLQGCRRQPVDRYT